MAAYSNYQMPQYGQAPPGQQSPYGQPQPQYSPQGQQMGMSMGQMPPQMQQQGQYFPNASAPPAGGRGPLRRSLSMGSAQEIKNQMALVTFDPYASTQTAGAPAGAPPAGAPAAYSNYSLPPAGGGDPFAASAPPAFTTEDMTTSPMTGASQYGFAQPPPPQYAQSYQGQPPAYDPTASTVSDISMFSSAPPAAAATSSALVPATETAVTVDPIAEAKAAGVDPKLIAEQEKIYADIQARNKMQEIRKRAGIQSNGNTSSRAMVPHQHGASHGGAMVPYGQGRQAPPRTRSMPNTNRSQDNSLARGGVAVLDPKKDLRKQTRKMKTAGGAVGGAVVGGLILGPVGVVLGAGGGAAVSNKMAKSRDKRKQQEFEQRNFQKGAASSVAAKGDGSFV